MERALHSIWSKDFIPYGTSENDIERAYQRKREDYFTAVLNPLLLN